jgi:UTP--glucose-1-phosphate uridylyltransferase
MKNSVRKAVIPVAGLGTRFLPATKAMPKEMLTVVDRPVIQHVVEEARASGIEHFVFVTGRNKSVIEDHFDKQFELEHVLESRGKFAALEQLAHMQPAAGQTSFTRQQAPLGLGHAIWCARDIVGQEPFAVLLPDVITHCPNQACLSQLIDAFHEHGSNMVGVERVPDSETHQYGIVALDPAPVGNSQPIRMMVEKPAKGTAPSNLSIMGRYILMPEIFPILGKGNVGAGNEIQLTDAMRELMKSQTFRALEFEGRSFDCGSKLGFLQANIALALENRELSEPLLTWLLENIQGASVEALRLAVARMHGLPVGGAAGSLVAA